MPIRSRTVFLAAGLLALLSGCAATPVPERLSLKEIDSILAEANDAHARNNCARAIPQYRRVLDKVRNDAQTLFRYGNCLAMLGDRRGAEAAWSQVVQVDPKRRDAWYNLTLAQLHTAAATLVEMRMALNQDNAEAQELDAIIDKMYAALQSAEVQPKEAAAAVAAGEPEQADASDIGTDPSVTDSRDIPALAPKWSSRR